MNSFFLLGVPMAPTAQLADKRKSHELEMCQLRVELQKEKIDELTKEREYLKEQLASGKSPYTQYSTVGSYVSLSLDSRVCMCLFVSC